jgi:hypothetical protein
MQALQSLELLRAGGDNSASTRELEAACRAGLCRCTLQLGDLRAARTLALALNNVHLYKECAHILEG